MLLNSILRQCFVLRILLGFSQEDAARLLGLEASEVTAHTSEAMQWLPNSLKPEESVVLRLRAAEVHFSEALYE